MKILQEANYAPVPPINLKFWEWGCPIVPEGYVFCAGRIDRARCPKAIECVGLQAGIYKIEDVVKNISEKKLRDMIGKGVLTKEQADAIKKDIEEVYKKTAEKVSNVDIMTRMTKFLSSPIGIALVIGTGILLIMFLMRK
jgi:hypothetical protein